MMLAMSPATEKQYVEQEHAGRLWWWVENEKAVVWYPRVARGRTYDDVPEQIGAAATEAHECRSVQANRAAVLLARSVVEATAKDKGIASGTLASKIDTMVEDDLLRKHIAAAAHEIRYLGNEMAHGDFATDVTPEEADEVLTLMGDVLEEVYSSPARIARVVAARKSKQT